MSIDKDKASFPFHEEQEDITKGFESMSAAGLNKVSLADDGMLVWTMQPTAIDCIELKIGERLFHCYQKDKYGLILMVMAGCDHMCDFCWADIRHPGVTSITCYI